MKYVLIILLALSLSGCSTMWGMTTIDFERDDKGIKAFHYASGKEFDDMNVSFSKDDNGLISANISINKVKSDKAQLNSNQRLKLFEDGVNELMDKLNIRTLLKGIITKKPMEVKNIIEKGVLRYGYYK